jgi:hypothetical protein
VHLYMFKVDCQLVAAWLYYLADTMLFCRINVKARVGQLTKGDLCQSFSRARVASVAEEEAQGRASFCRAGDAVSNCRTRGCPADDLADDAAPAVAPLYRARGFAIQPATPSARTKQECILASSRGNGACRATIGLPTVARCTEHDPMRTMRMLRNERGGQARMATIPVQWAKRGTGMRDS